ncbi:MAG: Signal peptidase I [Lachnoclostridium sp.]|jgi:signal peptidase I
MRGINEPKDYRENEPDDNIITPEFRNESEEDGKKATGKRKLKSVILESIIYFFIIYACLRLIPTYVVQRTIVDGPSMEDTLHSGEQLIVEKISYHFDQLKRFDIILFYPHGRENDEYYVKRIIGLPGETVQIKGSDIYINGKILKENYGKEPITYAGIAEEPITLGADEYFVLGDNREVSLDSRYEEVGPVSRENIGGRAILRIWPINKFGLLKQK